MFSIFFQTEAIFCLPSSQNSNFRNIKSLLRSSSFSLETVLVSEKWTQKIPSIAGELKDLLNSF